MNFVTTNTKLLLGAILTLFVATGCSISDSNNAEPKPVTVKMQVATNSAPKTFQKTRSSNHVTLTSVKMLVEELELESVEDDSTDFEVENQVVNLPLDGSPYQLSAENIAPGMYDEFEMEIEGLDDDDNVNDPDFTEGSDETSIVIRGTYNGEDFTYKSEEDFEFEFEFNPPIQIDENTNNVEINLMINIDTWFVDGSGNELDPTDPNHREQIEENIENSFEADKDEDDDDDDGDDEEDDDDDNDDDDDDDDDSDD
jgi:hypothetical protein